MITKRTIQRAATGDRSRSNGVRLAKAAQDYADLSQFIQRAEVLKDRAAELLRRHCPAGEFRVCGQHLVHVFRVVKHRVPAYVMPETLRLGVRKLGQ